MSLIVSETFGRGDLRWLARRYGESLPPKEVPYFGPC
jgi:hypothetical protein